MSEETKRCSKCGEVKALDLFRKEKNRIRGECKECEKQRDRARGTYRSKRWAINNPNRVKEIAAAYRARLPILVTSERMKKYRQDNPGKAKKYRAKYYAENSDKVKAYKKHKREVLSYEYVANTLRMKVADCPIELINLQREHIKIQRLAKEFKRTVKEVFK